MSKGIYNLRKRSILIVGMIVVLLLINNIYALGITPGRTSVNYEQGLEKEVLFSVLNNEHKDIQIAFMVRGELNDSITLYDSLVSFKSDKEQKQFKYKINLNKKLSPGLHTAEIVALEVPKLSKEGTYVGAVLGVVSQVYVYVPYPGKYVEADLNVLDAEENSTATLIVPVLNRGKLGVGEVRAIIDIYDSLNKKVKTIETDYLSLNPGARSELVGRWDVDVDSGNYLGKVSVFYDGETINFEKQFAVGLQKLSLESILVNNFKLGEIAKLQILVENKWNQELKSVFANLQVYDENQIMADIRSATEDILSLSKKELVAYWDTIGVQEGEYGGKLIVKYGQKSTDKNLVLKVSDDSLDIFGVGYAIRPDGGRGINLTTILFALIIILIIVNVTWLVYFIRKKKEGLK